MPPKKKAMMANGGGASPSGPGSGVPMSAMGRGGPGGGSPMYNSAGGTMSYYQGVTSASVGRGRGSPSGMAPGGQYTIPGSGRGGMPLSAGRGGNGSPMYTSGGGYSTGGMMMSGGGGGGPSPSGGRGASMGGGHMQRPSPSAGIPMMSPSVGGGGMPSHLSPVHMSMHTMVPGPPVRSVVMQAAPLDFEKQLSQIVKETNKAAPEKAAPAGAKAPAGRAGKTPGKRLLEEEESRAVPLEGRTVPPPGYLVVPVHKRAFQAEIQKIMTANGISKDSPACAEMLEDTAKQYVLDILKSAMQFAADKGTRMTVDDVMFQIHRDTDKFCKAQKVLALKEVLKTKGTAEADQDEIDEETKQAAKVKRVRLSWEVSFGLSDEEDEPEVLLSDEEDNMSLAKKLDAQKDKKGDDDKDFVDYRQTVFTFKKLKKFKDWLEVGSLDPKIVDDIVEVLGVLANECVLQCLAGALKVKAEQEGRVSHAASVLSPNLKKGLRVASLSASLPPTPSGRSAPKKAVNNVVEVIQPQHLQECLRRMKPSSSISIGFTPAQRKNQSRVFAP